MLGTGHAGSLDYHLDREQKKCDTFLKEAEKLFSNLMKNVTDMNNEFLLNPNIHIFELLELDVNLCNDDSSCLNYQQEVVLLSDFLYHNEIKFLKIFTNFSKNKTYIIFASNNKKIDLRSIYMENKILKMENLGCLSNLFFSVL
jgi:hypothetical protein